MMMMPNMLAQRMGVGQPMQPQPYPMPRPPMQGMPPNAAGPIMAGQFGMQGPVGQPQMPQYQQQMPGIPQNNVRMMMGAQ